MTAVRTILRCLFRLLVFAGVGAAAVLIARRFGLLGAKPAPTSLWQSDDAEPLHSEVARPEAVPSPVEVTPGEYAESAAPAADGSAPGPEWVIKAKKASMLFHTEASGVYGRTKADVWFRTATDAEAAGFRKHR